MAAHVPDDLTGMLLVAAPTLRDPNFRRTVLYVARHARADGAVGYVLNRPLDSTVEIEAKEEPLSVDLFFGGPVQKESLTLASLQWRPKASLIAFTTFGGEASDLDVPKEWESGLRAFAGYSGWSPGQLEGEIDEKAWIVIPPEPDIIVGPRDESLWYGIMRRGGPLLRLMAEAPDDPSLN